MKPRLYLETTIPSYLVARPSRDAVMRGQQVATQRWWDERRADYDLYVSALLIEEISKGDEAMAAARNEKIEGIPQLVHTPEVDALAERILARGIIPPDAAPDAEHIALAAVHAMNFLLTWNCRHIANAHHRRRLETACAEAGVECPILCTPASLL